MSKIHLIDENSNIFNSFDTKIRIVIPTLNRPKELLSNFKKIIIDFNRIVSPLSVQVVISENCSDSDKQIDFEILENIFMEYNSLNSLSVIFIQRKARLPLGSHMHWLGNISGTEWVMWLGDDDVLSPTYFKFVFDNIKNEKLMAIAPGYGAVDAKEFFDICDKNEDFEKPVFEKFSKDNMNSFIIHRGHQLSGLAYRETIIKFVNNCIPKKNLYPWMAYQIFALKNGEIYVIKGDHARITSDTPKLFSYGKDGLFPEISESIMVGFHDNYRLAVYYAIIVLGSTGYWRIFETTRVRFFSFFRFLAIMFNPRMNKIVFLGLSPIIFYRIVRSQASQIKHAVIK